VIEEILRIRKELPCCGSRAGLATSGHPIFRRPRANDLTLFVNGVKNAIGSRLAALLLITAGYVAPSLAQATADAATQRSAASFATDMCAICHDRRDGKGLAPRIAGQQREYIQAQLKAFQRQSRVEPEAEDCMWGLSSALTDNLVVALSDYFASQAPAAGVPGDPAEVAAGRRLFNRRDREGGIRSCAECHGDNAGGVGVVPRLAGQRPQYLARQMHVIQRRLRDSPTMHGLVKDLSDHDLWVLAIYLQSL
jgi:cytochrome c553